PAARAVGWRQPEQQRARGACGHGPDAADDTALDHAGVNVAADANSDAASAGAHTDNVQSTNAAAGADGTDPICQRVLTFTDRDTASSSRRLVRCRDGLPVP